VGGAGHVHTTTIFSVTGFPFIVVLRFEEVACLYINSLCIDASLILAAPKEGFSHCATKAGYTQFIHSHIPFLLISSPQIPCRKVYCVESDEALVHIPSTKYVLRCARDE